MRTNNPSTTRVSYLVSSFCAQVLLKMIPQATAVKSLMNQVRFRGSARSTPQMHQCHRATFISSMLCNSTAHILPLLQRNQFSTSATFHNINDSITEKNNTTATTTMASEDDDNFLLCRYKEMAGNANISIDEHQMLALTELDRLRKDILSSGLYTNETKGSKSSIGDNEEDDYFLPFMNKISSFFFQSSRGNVIHPSEVPKGVYLHGGVGCGKTFCMKLFYDTLPIESKQFVHFHKFMLTLHSQMHEERMVKLVKGDVLPAVIERIVEKGMVIAFDEFQVTDIADALILSRLFTGLLDKGAIIIATSNRAPCNLYLNGLQRELFLPFIKLLEEKNETVSMWESETDYRLVQGENRARGVFFVGEEAKAEFRESFMDLTKGSATCSTTLTTHRRMIQVPEASLQQQVAKFSFDDLCRNPRGAADYLLIGENFHTVFIENIPVLTINDVNLVRRFIIFVDAMYECNVKLIVHAETLPEGIFKVDLANKYIDEAFAFDRTRSRLQEMGSDKYLKSRWSGQKVKTDETREIIVDDRDMLSDELLKSRRSVQKVKTDETRNIIVDDRDMLSDELLKSRWSAGQGKNA